MILALSMYFSEPISLSRKIISAGCYFSKKISLEKFIYSLGIRHIGLENAKLLAKHFETFLNFKDLSKTKKYLDLLNIDGIGETQVNSIQNFFSNKKI